MLCCSPKLSLAFKKLGGCEQCCAEQVSNFGANKCEDLPNTQFFFFKGLHFFKTTERKVYDPKWDYSEILNLQTDFCYTA